MSSTTSPAPPVFSYAQAARGLQPGAATSQKSTDVSATSSEKGARGRQPSSTDGEKLESLSKPFDARAEESGSLTGAKPLEATHTSSGGTKENLEKSSVKGSKPSESSEDTRALMSPTIVSLSESEPSANHKDDEVLTGQIGASDTWDRQSEASASAEKANASNEKDKSQAGDDDWEKVSVPSISQEKELKAAPPPTVNIWQQRKQAQEAKQREQASQRPVSSSGKTPTSSGPVADLTKVKTAEKATGSHEKEVASKRKPADSAKPAADKPGQVPSSQGRPPSRHEQSTQNLPPPPPVGDAVAWPTPETATEADDRRKSSQEAIDKAEGKPGTKQQKKWTQVPFVPTAVFNTPLPPAAAKRGGRGGGSRGGRDGTGRGGHMTQNSVSGDKSEVAGLMGPPPLPRQGDQERGRKPDAVRGGRATSVPTQGRRATSAAATQNEPRKATGADRLAADPIAGEGVAFGEARNSRSSSRPTDNSSRLIANGNTEKPNPPTAPENTHAHPMIDPVARGSIPAEWYTSKPTGSNTRSMGEQNTREPSQPRSRMFQESRDKVESWRDRDPPTEVSIRREPRLERSTRGSHRGRGNASGYVPANTHAYTAPLPQQPFAPNKSHSHNDGRQRQSSQPYVMQPVSSGGRQPARSQSIPMQQQQLPNGMSPLSPIQTDMGMYGYYPQQLHPGFMSPVPHHPALDMYGLMALVTAQL